MADMEFDEIYRALSRPDGPKGLTRRRLLQAALIGAGAVAATPYLDAAAWATGAGAETAAGSGPAGEGVLVVIHMGGGNDGLNTLAPLADPAYAAARPGLALTADTALDVGDGFALHPNLANLK